MKKKFITISSFIIFLLLPNFSIAQYGFEVNYGLNATNQPKADNFSHFGAGFLYDINESFGVKLDVGYNSFRSTNEFSNDKKGLDITRISIQGTANISDLIDPATLYDAFNLSGHFGGGYSLIKSTEHQYNDNTINIIIGLTPKIRISQGFYFAVDAATIVNLSQHSDFKGNLTSTDASSSFTGVMYTVSAGIIYKFNEYY